MIAIFILLVILCFGFLVYENKHKQLNVKASGSSIPELILISVSISYLIYLGFFEFADYIRSFNIKVPHDRFIPPARAASYEFDGIEGYVLYSLMFVNLVVSFVAAHFITNIKNRVVYLSVFLGLTVAAAIYFVTIGFIPPMSNYNDYKDVNPFIVIVALLTTGLFWLLYKYLSPKIFLLVLALFLIPVCFIATEVLSIFDYSFILSPALRLIEGNPLSDIYFQYDLFLSLLAAAWMKLNIDLNLFQILGQLSFYALFIGVFIFSKKFFINKTFPVFIFILLLITRYYAIMHEPVAIFQVTPLRLELWLILLALVYYKGAYHWINAVIIGILLMFHKNFGLLYLLSYVQLILTFAVVDFADSVSKQKISGAFVMNFIKEQFFKNWKNLTIIAAFVGVSIVLFKGFIPKSALLYQQIGVGMIQISIKSFYWYIPAVLSLCFILLIKFRDKLSTTYFQAGLLIIFLTIGNSIYFFGRSHEHNILNIATPLVLLLFLSLDLMGFEGETAEATQKIKTKKNTNEEEPSYKILKVKRTVLFALPIVFIAGASYYYSEKVNHKLKTQYKNFKKSQYIYPLTIPTDFASVKKITNSSDSVYFLNYQDDFIFYYYGHYKPVGYFSPCATWILKDDLINFVQGLMDKGYYVVTTDMMRIAEILPELNYNRVASDGRYTSLSKDSVELLLPGAGAIAHIGMRSELGKNGINLTPINLNENFTVELLVKPGADQVDNSSIFVNAMTDSIGPSGFTFQQNGQYDNQFLFAYGGGKDWTPPAMFMLQANQWNYVVVAVKNREIKVFNNGQLVSTQKASFSIKNINNPLVIGNGIGRENQFNGIIGELKIVNDTITEQSIQQRLNIIKSKLN